MFGFLIYFLFFFLLSILFFETGRKKFIYLFFSRNVFLNLDNLLVSEENRMLFGSVARLIILFLFWGILNLHGNFLRTYISGETFGDCQHFGGKLEEFFHYFMFLFSLIFLILIFSDLAYFHFLSSTVEKINKYISYSSGIQIVK